MAVGLALRSLEPKSRILYWLSHEFWFNFPGDPNQPSLYTHALTVFNAGRRAATGIEIVHRTRPDYFKLQPALNYTEDTTPAGEHLTQIASLGPKELFTVEYLTVAGFSQLLYVRWGEGGHAKAVQMQPQFRYSNWVLYPMAFVLWVGAAFILYWLFRAVIFLSTSIF